MQRIKHILLVLLMVVVPLQGMAAAAGGACAGARSQFEQRGASAHAANSVQHLAGHAIHEVPPTHAQAVTAGMKIRHGNGAVSCSACASCCTGGTAPPSQPSSDPTVLTTLEFAVPAASLPVADFVRAPLKPPPKYLPL